MVRETHRKPFTWKDYLVIGVIWAPTIIVPWIDKWHEFLVPVYVAERKTVNRDYVNLAINLRLVFSCLLAFLVAFATDLIKRHYSVWSICLEIFTGAQIYGMVIYYTGPYEAADLVYWLSSVTFIGMAVQLSVIFSQNQNTYRYWSHLVLAACQLSYAVSLYCLFLVVYDRHRALFVPLGYFQILPWVAIMFFIILIIATRVLKRYSPVGNLKRPRVKASLKAVCWSIKNNRRTMKAIKFAMLASLVIPVCIPIATHRAVWHVDLQSDGTIDTDPTTEHAYLLGRGVGLIIVEAVLLGIRKINAKWSDVLSLGLPLILYLCVAIIIYYRLLELRPLQKAATKSLEEQVEHARVFSGPIPSKKQAVIEFYNARNDTIEVLSPNFILEGPLIPLTRVAVGLNETATVPIKVIVQDESDSENDTDQDENQFENGTDRYANGSEYSTEWSKCMCIISELDRFHSYIIHGNKTNIGIFMIHDHGKIKPTIKPVIVIMNSFMTANEEHNRILVWEEASAREVAFFESYSAFAPNTSIVVNVPIGGMKITYENLEEIEDIRNPNDRSTNVLITEPFVVYTILITLNLEGIGHMDSYEVMRVSISKDNVVIPKVQHCHFVQAAFVTMGTAYSSLGVAFFHHFWMDSNIRLRATIMAVCLATHQGTQRLIDANIKQLEPKHAFLLVILMGIVVAWHFIFASLYFCHFEFGYNPDEKGDAKDQPKRASPPSPKKPADHPKQVKFDETAEPVKPVGDL